MRKLMSTPAIVFKGSGWAKKDFRDSKSATKSSSTAAADGGAKKSSESGSGSESEAGTQAQAGSGSGIGLRPRLRRGVDRKIKAGGRCRQASGEGDLGGCGRMTL